MCGIAGWACRDYVPEPQYVIKEMTDRMAHRGPDGEGNFTTRIFNGSHQLALGHRRLSIIDLNARADQPMTSPNGQNTVVFNGEIYNYVELRDELRGLGHGFRTGSDTEVLLAAYEQWQFNAIPRFRGMFSFALWDEANERLVLARDPFGKKPLYLNYSANHLVFASELKSLLRHPHVKSTLDMDSVYEYLVTRYVPSPNTLVKDVTKLLPGHYAVYDRSGLSFSKYYTPPDSSAALIEPLTKSPEHAFKEAFYDSVKIRMRSDAPFGAFLSGGLDSSAIVAAMSEYSSQPVKTFSIGFQEDSYNELDYAQMVAKKFGTDHHELIVPSDQIVTNLPKLVENRGAPVSEPSDVPIFLLAQEASKSVKMVLTGEGADEFLGGYPKHAIEPYLKYYHMLLPQWVHDSLVKPLVNILPYGARRLKTLAMVAGIRDFETRMPTWFGAMSPQSREALYDGPAPTRIPNSIPYSSDANQTALRRTLFFDQTSWLPDNLLERGDRMMMAASIEGRMPFIDTKLAAVISSIPDDRLLRGRKGKLLLREIMSDKLPPEILYRKKVGFRVPVNEWFRTSLKDYVFDLLLSPNAPTNSYLDANAVGTLLSEHASGRQNHEKIIWTLLNLALFHQAFGEVTFGDA